MYNEYISIENNIIMNTTNTHIYKRIHYKHCYEMKRNEHTILLISIYAIRNEMKIQNKTVKHLVTIKK